MPTVPGAKQDRASRGVKDDGQLRWGPRSKLLLLLFIPKR